MVWSQAYKGQRVECSDLSENGPYKLACLNKWVSVVELFGKN